MEKTSGQSVIIQDKKILLLQRHGNKKVFPWSRWLPGGRSEENETPKQTSERETKEEAGLIFEAENCIHESTRGQRVLYTYTGKRKGEIHIQQEEAQNYMWADYQKAQHIKLAFDTQHIIEILFQEGKII